MCKGHVLQQTFYKVTRKMVWTFVGEVIAVVGSTEALGSWCHARAVPLQPVGDAG